MQKIITPEDMPKWVPGETLNCSTALGWKNIVQRSYRYKGQEVAIPPLNHFMIVRYHKGLTPMYRSLEGSKGTQTTCIPGDMSLLSSSQPSHWNWTMDIDVSHTYLSNDLMSRVAEDVLERSISEITLHDKLQLKDPIMANIIETFNTEAINKSTGSTIYTEALSIQLVVHLLRNYANVTTQTAGRSEKFSRSQEEKVREYVQSHMHEGITLEDLARELGLGEWSFLRQFRETFLCTPYVYIRDQRLYTAREQLLKTKKAIKEIAYACGFSDQAHMSRMIRSKFDATPMQIRNKQL